MRIRELGVMLSLLMGLWCSALADPHSVNVSEKASLQAAMQRHIDNALVKGRYLHLDTESGDVQALRPMAAHPVIMRMGEYFVLCADFRAEDGDEVNIDFYLARKGQSFVVFDEQVENRALLERLMSSGKLARMN